MTREEHIKKLIKEQGMSIKGFAKKIGIPYTTILTMLNKSLGGASVDTVILVCKNLGVSVDSLGKDTSDTSTETPSKPIPELITLDVLPEEYNLIRMYRQLDIGDKGEIKGEIKGMLRAEKYSSKKESLNA